MASADQAESSKALASAQATEPGKQAEQRTKRKMCAYIRYFTMPMFFLEAHYTDTPAMGPKTYAGCQDSIIKVLERTHTMQNYREIVAKDVETWFWMTKLIAALIPGLTMRSVGPLSSLNDPDNAVTPHESTGLIVKNYASLKEDLQLLSRIMHIARNLLVTSEPEVAQDLCAAVQFDQMLYQTIILCVNVTSKGYDGEVLDENSRAKLNEITDMYKKILVTSLQQAHNWTAKNDRNKMSFWFNVLFDEESTAEDQDSSNGDFRVSVAKTEMRHWMERNCRMCDKARWNLQDYYEDPRDARKYPGPVPAISPLAWNWLPEGSTKIRVDNPADDGKITPHWDENEPDKFIQDQKYGRVSREVDTWWLKARDMNYEEWVVPMPDVGFAHQRAENCKANLFHRYSSCYRAGHDHDGHEGDDEEDEQEDVDEDGHDDDDHDHDGCQHSGAALHPPTEAAGGAHHHHHGDGRAYPQDYVDDLAEDEDLDDDASYGEGPMTGLLTEVPNILDPKQIEALHMIVKSCILDNAGLGLTRAGENLQKTRCRMFLASDCGKSLLREILVFIAVWEKNEHSLIFQITTQIAEAIHHSALIPYTWQAMRIPKDLISPAQTVLVRLVDHIFRARNKTPPAPESKENMRDIKLLHFLFIQFRSRIVPECIALMYLQEEIRNGKCDPADFPVDNWDMDRAKDGLEQFLFFLQTVSDLPETRAYLVKWEATYELLALLKALDGSVPKKPMVNVPKRSANRPGEMRAGTSAVGWEHWDQARTGDGLAPPPPPPPMHDQDHDQDPEQEPAYKFSWAGIKVQILMILAALLSPPQGRMSPGNPDVQRQIVKFNGMARLLNCCVYDDHNPYARERVTICLKWLMDGCDEANEFLRKLVQTSPPPLQRAGQSQASASGSGSNSGGQASASASASATTSLRVDGIPGEVRVQVRNPSAPGATTAQGSFTLPRFENDVIHPRFVDYLNNMHDQITNQANTLPPMQTERATGTTGGPSTTTTTATATIAAAAAQIQSQAQQSFKDKILDPATTAAVLSALNKVPSLLASESPGAMPSRARSEELLRDIINLADEAARLALGPQGDSEETEEEEFM